MSARNSWAEILKLLAPSLRGVKMPLGASEDEIRSTIKHIGLQLPKALIDIYRLHNGGPNGRLGEPLLYGYAFLSLEDVRYYVDLLRENLDNLKSLPPPPSYPRNAVQCKPRMMEWIPFANDGGWNFLGIDLAPGPIGVSGQVINFGRDDEVRLQIATDFGSFLKRVAADYRRGRGAAVLGDSLGFVDRCRAELLGEGPYAKGGGGPYVARVDEY